MHVTPLPWTQSIVLGLNARPHPVNEILSPGKSE